MILADENIDHSLIKPIRDAGFEVYSIYESNRGHLTKRYAFPETEAISEILIRLPNERSERLFRHFTTITTQKIRSKPFL